MNQCPQCNSQRIVGGWLGTDSKPAMFRPAGLRSFTVAQDSGARLATADASACLDCGLAWNSTSPEKLRRYVQRHCDQTSDNAVAFEGCEPSSGWKERWMGGWIYVCFRHFL